MSDRIGGIESLDLGYGEYTVVPSEWRHEAEEQLVNLTSGNGEGGEPLWHTHDVQRPDGDRLLEVVDDRRGTDGLLDTDGRQFLFRSPDGEALMAFERAGFWTGDTATLRDADGAVLATWEQSIPMFGDWTLSGPDGRERATVQRSWSLEDLAYPAHVLESPSGETIGEFAVTREGLFYEVEVSLEPSAVPPEVCLAAAYGIAWATSDL